VIDAIKMYNPELVLVALAGSHLVEQARAAGLKVVSEAFADRAYNSDGSLVSRRLDGAVLHDSAFVARRVVSMLKNGGVESIDGVFTPIQADTICLHGDTAGALEMSAAIKAELLNHHIEIRPFVLKHEEDAMYKDIRVDSAQLEAALDARLKIRAGFDQPTAGMAAGMTQVNMISVPKDWAYDFLVVCTSQSAKLSCFRRLEEGVYHSRLAENSDIRTDFPRYRIWKEGEMVDEVTDASDIYHAHPDLVTF
jgi:hypothetical protein